MTPNLSPQPRRQPMIICTDCGAANDPARGSKYCRNCGAELPAASLSEIAARAEVIAVPFLEGHIPCFMDGDEPMVILKPIAEGVMGLSWPRQYAKLSADQTARVAFRAIHLPGDDRPRKVMGVSLETFTLWLAGLQPSRVKPEAREVVMAYRRDAARALREHFFGQPRREMSKADWIRQALEIEEERERLALENAELREENAAMAPAVEAYEQVVEARGLIPMAVFAQQSGITRPGGKPLGQNTAIAALRELRILKDAPGTELHNTPYQEHAHRVVVKTEQRGPVTVNSPYVVPAHAQYLAARIYAHFYPGHERLPRPRFGQLRAIEGGA